MWALIDELVRGGTTTLLTTQYLDEADRLADDIVVIDRGTVIARGTSEELKQQIGGELIEIQPIMFIVLFVYVFGGATQAPGYSDCKQYLLPGIFAQTVLFASATGK